MTTTADIASFFSTAVEWNAPPNGHSNLPEPEYLGGDMLDPAAARGHYPFVSDPHDLKNTNSLGVGAARPMNNVQNGSGFYGDFTEAPALLRLGASGLTPSQGRFTAMNVPGDQTNDNHTISPLQTRVDSAFGSTPSYSTEDGVHSATSSKLEFWGDMDADGLPAERRHDSLKANSDKGSPKHSHGPGRRRRSENVEPGSARAIYLEKNREAASKCRSKQKMQQEELVETAREVEQKNKVLKAEVEFLKGDLRGLMEIVGKHSCCPDKRLHTYVQREADRLASGYAGSTQSPAGELLSPNGSALSDSQQ